jgi:hypothetical protein
MLLCGECYENVYTYRHSNYPLLKMSLYAYKTKQSRHSHIWNTVVMLFLKHPVFL